MQPLPQSILELFCCLEKKPVPNSKYPRPPPSPYTRNPLPLSRNWPVPDVSHPWTPTVPFCVCFSPRAPCSWGPSPWQRVSGLLALPGGAMLPRVEGPVSCISSSIAGRLGFRFSATASGAAGQACMRVSVHRACPSLGRTPGRGAAGPRRLCGRIRRLPAAAAHFPSPAAERGSPSSHPLATSCPSV